MQVSVPITMNKSSESINISNNTPQYSSKLVQLPRRSDSGQLLASANGQGQVTNLGLTDESGNNPENLPLQVHPLHSSWVFWFMHRPPGQKLVDYEGAMKRISAFSSIEEFWAVYSHLRRPHELPTISDYHLFKDGIRPVWEDEANINGGKWIVRFKKGLASRFWENLVLGMIGQQFDVGDEICGAVISIRHSEDILSIWNKTAKDGETNTAIRDTLKKILNLPSEVVMEYKSHNDALKDNSSFRNTDVYNGGSSLK